MATRRPCRTGLLQRALRLLLPSYFIPLHGRPGLGEYSLDLRPQLLVHHSAVAPAAAVAAATFSTATTAAAAAAAAAVVVVVAILPVLFVAE